MLFRGQLVRPIDWFDLVMHGAPWALLVAQGHSRGPAASRRVSARLALTVGDPAGIGPEIVLKALSSPERPSGSWVVYGPLASLEERAARFALKPIAELGIPVVDVGGGPFPLGQVSAEGGRAAAAAVLAAARDALAGRVDAVVTAPLHKESLRAAGHPWPGHTEMLAEAASVSDVAMMFVGGGLRVALLTIHRSLRSVPRRDHRARGGEGGAPPPPGAAAVRGGAPPDRRVRGEPARGGGRALRPGGPGDRGPGRGAPRRRGPRRHGPPARGHGVRAGGARRVRRGGGRVPRPGARAGEARGLRPRGERDAGPALRAHVGRPRHGVRHRRVGDGRPREPPRGDGARLLSRSPR